MLGEKPQSAFQFILKGSVQNPSIPTLANVVFIDLTLHIEALSCWNTFGLHPLVPVQGDCNGTANMHSYNDA